LNSGAGEGQKECQIIMVPMAIPSFGGMTIQILTVLVVPVLYSWIKEAKIRRQDLTS